MEQVAKELKSYSLSNDDINRILHPKTNILIYPDFANMSSIDEAFDELGRCIFLFLTESERVGHWLCMYKKDNTIHYFDSYGQPPEAQREWLTEEQLDTLGEGQPYLWNLLKKSGCKVYYSTFPYQKETPSIATCGRWCVTRLICRDLTDVEFFNLVKDEMKKNDIKTYDKFVSFFIADILGK